MRKALLAGLILFFTLMICLMFSYESLIGIQGSGYAVGLSIDAPISIVLLVFLLATGIYFFRKSKVRRR